ncbi:hypothetical protein [Halorhabdus sp. SVX81]|nr:hypothetical protein [Halorhabdus sp. SVX81]
MNSGVDTEAEGEHVQPPDEQPQEEDAGDRPWERKEISPAAN